ncbi:hypothetical protein NLI96_g1231 [Meripilus lineatus]|uniref:Uncharacterized protein n=1 Tax=Meripilus lineatus TaxID=2056292 RepID=A0AAD5VD99_9APHY|nr:hypothetical protein NLI96_g1231 [Physisporinus lineatus]
MRTTNRGIRLARLRLEVAKGEIMDEAKLPLFMNMNIQENNSADSECDKNGGLARGDGTDDMYGDDTADVRVLREINQLCDSPLESCTMVALTVSGIQLEDPGHSTACLQVQVSLDLTVYRLAAEIMVPDSGCSIVIMKL